MDPHSHNTYMRGSNSVAVLVLVGGASACGGGRSVQGPPVAPAAQTFAMTTRMTFDSGAAKHVMAERFVVGGAKTRMEISSDDSARTYMVIDSKDQTMMTVMPSLKMTQIMKAPSMKIDYVPPKVETSKDSRAATTDLGPGEPILGFATHRYRYTHGGTSTLTYSDRVCTETTASTRDVWLTTDPAAVAIQQAVDRGMDTEAHMFTSRRSSKDAKVAAAPKDRGLEMRSISYDTTIDASGARKARTNTTEITELSAAPLDTTLFTAPGGFRVMDMRGITISGDMSKVFADSQTLRPGCVARH
jgi:hypothetical protein